MAKRKDVAWHKTTTRCRPPMRKVVVGTWGGWYFLCCRQSWGWEECPRGGRIAQPRAWCDIPACQFMMGVPPKPKRRGRK